MREAGLRLRGREADPGAVRGIAEEATRRGGAVLSAHLGRAHETASLKGAGDYVTAADSESEAAIRAWLREATPEVPVVGEEEGGERLDAYWTVDPLDGTRNFVLGFPVVAVSVALVVDGRPVAGAVGAPMLGFTCSAARGAGAWSGARKLEVSPRPPREAIVATGFPLRDRTLLPGYLPVLEEVLARVEDLRRPGAAALDLAWVAAGVFDGYFELNLSEWDVAAGGLLVEEAGGVVTDWAGGPGWLSGDVLAGSPATHPVLARAAARRA